MANTCNRPPKRRFLRFSLRSMLLLTTLVAVVVGVRLNRANRQKVAVRYIQQVGGVVQYDIPSKPKQSARARLVNELEPTANGVLEQMLGIDFFYDVKSVEITPRARSRHEHMLELSLNDRLLQTTSPQVLQDLIEAIARSRATAAKQQIQTDWDAAIAAVSELRTVESIELDCGRISSNQLELFGKLPRLKSLNLHNVLLQDSEAPSLRKLERLSSLVADNRFSDAGLLALEGHPALEQIYLNYGNSSITDKGMRSLATMRRLRVIDVSGCEITDAGVRQLSRIRNLRWLDLSFTQVSDHCVENLLRLQQLRTLRLHATRITSAAVERLRQQLPNAKIVHSHSSPD